MIVLQETGWKSVHWIHLDQDIDKLQALTETVLNLGFHKVHRISWLEKDSPPQFPLCADAHRTIQQLRAFRKVRIKKILVANLIFKYKSLP
jgi:hypothetical protein